MSNLKPWREVAVPHEDVLKGTFQQAEFAADLSRVHDGSAGPEYQDPALFFQRTFVTEGMRLLLDSVVRRLAGRGGDPVIQLQTAFGGGKTHTMLAVYHLARGAVPASDLHGIPQILNAAGIVELPRARIAVLDGIRLSPNQPLHRGGTEVHTLWGELAWQLGGESAYARVREADRSGTSPGKEVLAALLAECAPLVILIDELVAYVRQFEEGKSYSGGSYDSNLSFVQALTEALKAVPTAVLLASLPESEKEAGGQRGRHALETLAHYFGRVQALWKPVATEEAFEIVRRRLFARIDDPAAMQVVCEAFADFYVANAAELPNETQANRYRARLAQAYPIHPEVFDRLYEDWSTLDNFQRTRGVLKLMAKVVHRLWNDGNNDLLVMPGSLPLYDADTRNEVVYYLPPGWDPVLERDIDGARAETAEIERDSRFGAIHACRRAARTVFLGSAPTTAHQTARGLELARVLLGAVQPGQPFGTFKDALNRLSERLHYLNHGNGRYWFDTRPNLRREMEERKRRFDDRDDVFPLIRDRLQRSLAAGPFGGIHVFTPAADVPDDWALRLVALPPDAPHSRTGQSRALEQAAAILRARGEQPRQKQNRLLFLAADYDSVGRLKDHVRSLLAWESIVGDYKANRIVLDNLMARNAEQSLETARQTVQRTLRETCKWLLAPLQQARPGKGVGELVWETFQVNPSAANLTQEIERVLQENELLISTWAPVHLARLLKDWFWKGGAPEANAAEVWQKTCCYLYLPRLRDDSVYRHAIAAGAPSRDFFGLAQGKDGEHYLGFVFGEHTAPIVDGALLLIEPAAAAAYAEAQKPKSVSPPTDDSGGDTPAGDGRVTPPVGLAPMTPPPAAPTASSKRRFYGQVDVDPVRAKFDFASIVDEVVEQFSARPDVRVRVRIEIEAETSERFDDGLQRAVKENCSVLKFRNAEFEE